MSQRGFELGSGIRFAIRRKKKSCLVRFAFVSAGKRPAIVEEQVPIALLMERENCCPLNEFLKIGCTILLSFGAIR